MSSSGDDAAAEDGDVGGALSRRSSITRGNRVVVRAGEDRQRDRVDVLLDRGRHDHLGGLVQAGVDDLEARVPERARDDLRPAVVTVEADLSDQQPEPSLLAHPSPGPETSRYVPNTGTSACESSCTVP